MNGGGRSPPRVTQMCVTDSLGVEMGGPPRKHVIWKQGSLKLLHINGNFEDFPYNSGLFGLVIQ